MTVRTEIPVPSALAHHSDAIIGTIRIVARASQVLRRPSRSIEAPRNGAVAMMNQPEYWLHRETISCPRTGSPTMVAAT